MTLRLLHALALFYAATALVLIRCAADSWRDGHPLVAVFLMGAAVLMATAIVHHSYQHDELRDAQRQLEAAARPDEPEPAFEGVLAVALAGACCERWWTSAGAEHEPTTCTRKGHHA